MTYIDRTNSLMSICPEYAAYINANRLPFLYTENPSLYIASSAFIFFESELRGDRLIFELNSWINEPIPETILQNAFTRLARFYAESGESTNTMALLRWMQENGYTADKIEPLRL